MPFHHQVVDLTQHRNARHRRRAVNAPFFDATEEVGHDGIAVEQAAELLQVSLLYLDILCEQGRLGTVRVTASGRRTLSRQDVLLYRSIREAEKAQALVDLRAASRSLQRAEVTVHTSKHSRLLREAHGAYSW